MGGHSKLTRKQHWVPQFYLRHFADRRGGLYAYNRMGNNFYSTNTRDACSSNYLHEVERKHKADGASGRFLRANRIEDGLSRAEGLLAPIYDGFIRCCESGKLDGEEFHSCRLAVCYLFASLIERHPLALKERRAGAIAIAQDYLESKRLTEAEAERLRMHGMDGELEGATEQFAMEASLFTADQDAWLIRISSKLYDMGLTVAEAPVGTEFVSTSLPLYTESDVMADGFEPEIAYMPLSSRYAAFFVSEKKPMPFKEHRQPRFCVIM